MMKSNKSELTRYRQYESEKRKLRGLSPKEYEQAVKRLLRSTESSMLDYSALIKQSVTMPDVLAMYGFEPGRYNRIPCPIHNGVKRNFAYKEHGFVCYVCGATGDVISFVEKLFGLSFKDACRKIDQDFNLGLNIGGEMDKAKRDEAERVCAERRAEKRRRDAERKRLSNAYHAALDRWCELDKAIRDGAPKTPFDDFSDSYAYALQHIDHADAVLSEAEIQLWEFEHERKTANAPIPV